MRGRKPLPNHLHVIAGTATSATADAVTYSRIEPPAFPDPPAHLNDDGKKIWNEVGRELSACGVLQVVDVYALSQLAYMWQRHMSKARNNEEMISAEVMALRSLFAEFGMTPSSRRRVGNADDAPKDKKNRFSKFKQKQ